MGSMAYRNMKSEPQCIVTVLLKAWAWLALVPLLIIHSNSALGKRVTREITCNNKPGFISIDCGSNIDYLDEDTEICYQTDDDFVETGTNMVASNMSLNFRYFGRQLNTLRCFPEGERNCYTLKTEQGENNQYLIRAFFSYGNYDLKNQTPSFDLYIGVNLWDTFKLNNGYLFGEIIISPSSDSIQVCLVKTGPTIPCISSLELRPLNNSIYQDQFMSTTTTPKPLLSLEVRIDVGSPQLPAPDDNMFFKYADDVYDRLWRCDPSYNSSGWYSLDEPIDIDPAISDDVYKLPAQVLRTAARSQNVSLPLHFDLDSSFLDLNESYEYCVYFHFAEIEKLANGQKRIINIITLLNSQSSSILSKPVVLEYLKPVTISPRNPTQGSFSFNITATSESDAPPILNAFEIFKLKTQLVPPTDAQDVGAILGIKSAYHISRLNWQGDPCAPKQYAWEGLLCSSYDTNPRITSLNLSSSGITGEINASFSYLTQLEFLDLSHNQLEGPVPEFLAELPMLKVLNLTGTNFRVQFLRLSGKRHIQLCN